jgi:hypothetical protein
MVDKAKHLIDIMVDVMAEQAKREIRAKAAAMRSYYGKGKNFNRSLGQYRRHIK